MSQLIGEYQITDRELCIPVQVSAAHSVATPESQNKVIQLRGLIDTGATYTILSQVIVKELRLNSIGNGSIGLANNQFITTQRYLVDIALQGQAGQQVLKGHLVHSAEQLSDDIIIGMDIISTWYMDWRGPDNIIKIAY